jgi:hypothetical protein
MSLGCGCTSAVSVRINGIVPRFSASVSDQTHSNSYSLIRHGNVNVPVSTLPFSHHSVDESMGIVRCSHQMMSHRAVQTLLVYCSSSDLILRQFPIAAIRKHVRYFSYILYQKNKFTCARQLRHTYVDLRMWRLWIRSMLITWIISAQG